jgi:hypothetical protein
MKIWTRCVEGRPVSFVYAVATVNFLITTSSGSLGTACHDHGISREHRPTKGDGVEGIHQPRLPLHINFPEVLSAKTKPRRCNGPFRPQRCGPSRKSPLTICNCHTDGFSHNQVQSLLELIQSLLILPEDPNQPIQPFHKSFPDFITDPPLQ